MAAILHLWQRACGGRLWRCAPPFVRRVIVGVVGGTVLLIGLAATLIPGVPAIVVIPIGLAILATEFVWARRWLQKARDFVSRMKNHNNPDQIKPEDLSTGKLPAGPPEATP
jgi:hypothetical protein